MWGELNLGTNNPHSKNPLPMPLQFFGKKVILLYINKDDRDDTEKIDYKNIRLQKNSLINSRSALNTK